MKPLTITYDNEELQIYKTTYVNNNNLAIVAICDDGDTMDTITVNLFELPENMAYVDTENWSDIDKVLVESGIAKMIGLPAESGWCECTLFEFDIDNIPAYDEYKKYMEEKHAAT